jgi:urease accessory protein
MRIIAEQSARLASQRVHAEGRVSARRLDGRTRLARLFQEGAAKIRLPERPDRTFEAVLINTAGGLTGGDRLAWSINVGPRAEVVATTQACEKIYRSAAGTAEVACRIEVAEGGRVAWLPQETILFSHSALSRSLSVELAPDAEALLVETTLFGRSAMGERVTRALFRDRWRIRQGGRLIHAEEFALGPEVEERLARPAVAGGATATATVLGVGVSAERHLGAVRGLVGEAGGASFWTVGRSGKLLARLVAEDGYALRKRLIPLLGLLSGAAGLPKVWSL